MNKPIDATSQLLTTHQAAALLAISESMVRKLVTMGTLPRVVIGRSVRIRLSDVQALIIASTNP